MKHVVSGMVLCKHSFVPFNSLLRHTAGTQMCIKKMYDSFHYLQFYCFVKPVYIGCQIYMGFHNFAECDWLLNSTTNDNNKTGNV